MRTLARDRGGVPRPQGGLRGENLRVKQGALMLADDPAPGPQVQSSGSQPWTPARDRAIDVDVVHRGPWAAPDDQANRPLCADMPGSFDGDPTRESQAICRRCPARDGCLDLGAWYGNGGTWAGQSSRSASFIVKGLAH